MDGLNMGIVKELPVCVAPMKLQKKYEHIAGQIRSQKNLYISHQSRMEDIFSSLQQKAFKGVRQLERFLKDYITQYNLHCGPFEWTASPQKLQKIIKLTHEYQNA